MKFHIIRALRYKNYRLFFGGQTISLVGTWMQQVAMGWMVYRMTHSAFLLGIIGFASQIPSLVFTPFAGVLVDRWSRHRILIITQILAMAQASILTVLVMTHHAAVWQLVLLSFVLGIINAVDAPARQAFVLEMVENKKDLGNAIALNSTMFNSARLIGPFIAGIIIASAGEGICFLANALSYIAVLAALLAMDLKPKIIEQDDRHILQRFKEGFNYAFGFPPIRAILLFIGLVSFVGIPYAILLPVFATQVLKGGPQTFGFLVSASGIGALGGALYLASRKSVVGLGRAIVFSSCLFGISLMLFALSHTLWFSLVLMVLAGFGTMVHMASSNTVLQTIVEDDKRGRVMGFFIMAFMGTAPFGSLLIGSLASGIGSPNTLLIGGAICIIGSIVFASKLPALMKMIHPIYVKMGIMPEFKFAIK